MPNVSPEGFWILVKDSEYFLPFSRFPWFRDATISEISNVVLIHSRHLRWEDLDIDLELDSLSNLSQYPLQDKLFPPRLAGRRLAGLGGTQTDLREIPRRRAA